MPEFGEFTCECCGETFSRKFPDAEERAWHEHEQVFGPREADFKRVCHGCYQELMAWVEESGLPPFNRN